MQYIAEMVCVFLALAGKIKDRMKAMFKKYKDCKVPKCPIFFLQISPKLQGPQFKDGINCVEFCLPGFLGAEDTKDWGMSVPAAR